MHRSKSTANSRVLFVHNNPIRFVQIDHDLLRERWDVYEWYQRTKRVNILALARMVRRCDLVFGWFASWHTYCAVLCAYILRKPSVLVIGGYDVADMPEIDYGHQRGGLKKWVSRWTIQLATHLITASEYSREEACRNAAIPKERICVSYHGVPDPFGILPELPESQLVLSVGKVDKSNLARKGHRAFVQAARLLPNVKFVLVGKWEDDAIDILRTLAPSNVQFTGWIEPEVLNDYYRKASVYVQASEHEGFGMAVAEAMLAGCVPVVTKAGSLPEVVGDTGIYLSSKDPVEIASAVQEALNWDTTHRQIARERILTHFPLERRKEALFKVITEALENGRLSI